MKVNNHKIIPPDPETFCFYPRNESLLYIYFPVPQYLVLACVSLALAASSLPRTRTENDLTCDICVDVMTDIDDFITSDTTEQQLVDFIKQVIFSI